MRSVRGFLEKTCGLTTIEWVALAAVCLLAAFGISSMVLQGADRLGGSVATGMKNAADDID